MLQIADLIERPDCICEDGELVRIWKSIANMPYQSATIYRLRRHQCSQPSKQRQVAVAAILLPLPFPTYGKLSMLNTLYTKYWSICNRLQEIAAAAWRSYCRENSCQSCSLADKTHGFLRGFLADCLNPWKKGTCAWKIRWFEIHTVFLYIFLPCFSICFSCSVDPLDQSSSEADVGGKNQPKKPRTSERILPVPSLWRTLNHNKIILHNRSFDSPLTPNGFTRALPYSFDISFHSCAIGGAPK